MKENKYKESHSRSIIKALSWRLFATVATILIVFAFTRKLTLSLEIGIVEVVTKLILYYFHERIWAFISFGRRKHPLASLPIHGSIQEKDLELIKHKLKELGYISED